MNSSNNENGGNGNSGTSFGAKAGYIGAGVVIGLIAYPFVRKYLGQVQPKLDKILDDLTGRAENAAEKASDILAKAKASFGQQAPKSEKHEHSHEGNGHEH